MYWEVRDLNQNLIIIVKDICRHYDIHNSNQTDVWADFVSIALAKAEKITEVCETEEKEIVMNATLFYEVPFLLSYKRRWECDSVNYCDDNRLGAKFLDDQQLEKVKCIVYDTTNQSSYGKKVFASYYFSLVKGAASLFTQELYQTGSISVAIDNTINLLSKELRSVDKDFVEEATREYKRAVRILEAKKQALKDNMFGSIICGDLGIKIEERGCD